VVLIGTNDLLWQENIVLLSTDPAAPVFTDGMFSGNSAGASMPQQC
jgi:hypothetical protein